MAEEEKKTGGRWAVLAGRVAAWLGRGHVPVKQPPAPGPTRSTVKVRAKAARDPDRNKAVYWLKPACGGFANNLVISTDAGKPLFQVRSRLFAPSGRRYAVFDVAENRVIMHTRQDHTHVFPRHTVFRGERAIATVGQNGIIPQAYYIHCGDEMLDMRFTGFSSIFPLTCGDDVVAEAGQGRGCWCVVTTPERAPTLLPLIAIIYRENSIGG